MLDDRVSFILIPTREGNQTYILLIEFPITIRSDLRLIEDLSRSLEDGHRSCKRAGLAICRHKRVNSHTGRIAGNHSRQSEWCGD